MSRHARAALLLTLLALPAAVARADDAPAPAAPAAPAAPKGAALEAVATSAGSQWTGMAVSKTGRVFTCFPRWLAPYANAVVEVLPDGTTKPFPDATHDGWDPESIGAPRPGDWVCVQSVHCDAKDRLWVLDPASPAFAGVVPGGPKLVAFDLATGETIRAYPFPAEIASGKAYLNDVRVDAERDVAYLTDSGVGAIVVVHLVSGKARKFLVDDPRTKAEPDVKLKIGGKELHFQTPEGAEGPAPQVHADGIALDRKGEWLYWQALTGRTLYRVRTEALRAADATDATVAAAVEKVGPSVASDGMEIDEAGNVYLTSIEQDALVMRKPDGTLVTLASDPRLAWPDSIAFGPAGTLYVSCSQIHRTPMVHPNTEMPKTPFALYRLKRP